MCCCFLGACTLDEFTESAWTMQDFLILFSIMVYVASCHCVALDVEGRCYTWGRNEVC